jgi:hypothetical protein
MASGDDYRVSLPSPLDPRTLTLAASCIANRPTGALRFSLALGLLAAGQAATATVRAPAVVSVEMARELLQRLDGAAGSAGLRRRRCGCGGRG